MTVERIGTLGKLSWPEELGSPPPFGPNGESPPRRSEAAFEARTLIATDGRALPASEVTLIQVLRKHPTVKGDYDLRTRRLSWRRYWERNDPVLQLAPGETQTFALELTSGLTDQVSSTFSTDLGFGGNVSAIALSAHLSTQLSRTVTITTEKTTTVTKVLTNSRDGYLRRVALWRVHNILSLDRVVWGNEPGGPSENSDFQWRLVREVDFAEDTQPQWTYADVAA